MDRRALTNPNIVGDWDLTGLTAQQRLAALELLFPGEFEKERLSKQTPRERDEEIQSWLAIVDPESYAKFHPVIKTQEQQERDEASAWAISHPLEFTTIVKSGRTATEREEDDRDEWAITHPFEATQIAAAAQTQKDEATRAQALQSIATPEIKPKRVPKSSPKRGF